MFGSTNRHKELAVPGEETFTFLARGFEFKGTLTFEGTVRIDGMVSGAIYSKGTVILGEHAVIEGDISAGTIVSSGTINGNVTAVERVHLLPSAELSGDLKTPLLRVEEGVQLHGNCEAEGRAQSKGVEEPQEAATHEAKVRALERGEVLQR
jgi:cytoskeletal protein CcmA (bactofilin family)